MKFRPFTRNGVIQDEGTSWKVCGQTAGMELTKLHLMYRIFAQKIMMITDFNEILSSKRKSKNVLHAHTESRNTTEADDKLQKERM